MFSRGYTFRIESVYHRPSPSCPYDGLIHSAACIHEKNITFILPRICLLPFTETDKLKFSHVCVCVYVYTYTHTNTHDVPVIFAIVLSFKTSVKLKLFLPLKLFD
jgi:hypothetical protein